MGLLAVAACGRLDFTSHGPTGVVGPALDCGAPARFASGGATLNALAAAGVPDGFSVFTANSTGALAGWAYAFSDGQLVASEENVALGANATGALGAVSHGDTVILSSMLGMPTATGTNLFPLDENMSMIARPAALTAEYAAPHPVATSGIVGKLAFVTIDDITGEADGRAIAANGSDAGAIVTLVAASAAPANLAIATAPAGFTVAYTSTASSPRQVMLQLHDESFHLTAGPTAVDTPSGSEYAPATAWAGDVLLVAWHAKDATDEVWIALFDSKLQQRVPPMSIATSSSNAVVASDGTGFWLAWSSSKPTNHLDGAHVAVDGTVTPRPIVGTTGTPGKWAMVERGTQPVLVWTEVGGSGPDLYLDPMCGP
jgi:hypothetical protein